MLIYDQVCATEKRRRRKRGLDGAAGPPRRDQRGGVRELRRLLDAIRLYRHRTGGDRARPQAPHQPDELQRRSVLPEGVLPQLRHPGRAARGARRRSTMAGARERARRRASRCRRCRRWNVWRGLFAGIGGGGIVTSGAILAMAAHLEGRAVKTLDFTGLAQKNGAVVAHVQIAADEAALDVVRIPLGTADLMLAADLAVGCQAGVLERNARDVGGDRQPGPGRDGGVQAQRRAVDRCGAASSHDRESHRQRRSVWLHGVRLAERLFGNSQAMNTMLLGMAWQRGLVPVGEAAILRAIELNGAAVKLNKRAFLWGRILAEQPGLMKQILDGLTDGPPADLDALIAPPGRGAGGLSVQALRRADIRSWCARSWRAKPR